MLRCTVICVLCGLAGIAAQNRPFRVQAEVVQLPVSVVDRNGRTVGGLTARDFTVLADGARQEATLDDFSFGTAPISLVIAVQTAGISAPALARIRRIGGLIQPLLTGPRGAVSVVTFDSRINWLQDFTSDDNRIRAALESIEAGKSLQNARMLDAVASVARHLQQRSGRRILLLLSESHDRGSETTTQQAFEAVERLDIEVFAAHYSAFAISLTAKPKDLPDLSAQPELPDYPLDKPNPAPVINFTAIFTEAARRNKAGVVQALTRATGGSDYPFLKERGLEDSIEKLGVEVHSQYILSFPEPKSTAGWHQISVSLPNHGDLRIRSRTTYWSE
jgi:VWFA-related protein